MRLKPPALALVCYSIIISGVAMAAMFWIVTDKDAGTPSAVGADLSACSLPAVSRWDLRPDPSNDLATNRTPCEALPAGLILICSDFEPRESIEECGDNLKGYFAP